MTVSMAIALIPASIAIEDIGFILDIKALSGAIVRIIGLTEK
jgi:hypothetical protein